MRYTEKEQKQHRKELVEALRSGKYQQGFERLRDGNRFCCLGVACDISGLGEWYKFTYLEEKYSLPDEVIDYYGFNSTGGYFNIFSENYIEDEDISLIRKNDSGSSFEEIADIIEKEPEGMFE